ncbi:pyridoxamine 5'-phosphate oxidase family protein [Tenacibaculum amylolyticum]|uniref:pyridoxamine 5'-phosphate oxidase family protein n=1 Tax=Tenacibaculum amylolyticum TaxID=104269 RepID=UPI003893ABEF
MNPFEKSKLNRVKRGQNRAIYDEETIFNIIDAGFLAHVGYIYDGYPISIPMAYTREENSLYLHGSTGNRMMLSILESGKTSINITHLDGLVLARSGLHHSVNYRSVTLFGSVKKVIDDERKTVILEKTINQMVPNRWETLRTMIQEELNRTLILQIDIDHASAKVRAEGVNDEPDDINLPIWAGVIPVKQIALEPVPDENLIDGITTPKHITTYYEKHR